MPSKRSKNRVGLNNLEDKAVSFPFRYYTSVQFPAAAGAQISGFNLSIATGILGPRVTAMATLYEFYRIVKLRVRSDTNMGASVYNAANVGLINGTISISYDDAAATDTAAPVSDIIASQLQHFELGGPYSKLKFTVKRPGLQGPNLWLHTATTGAPNADTLSQGTFYMIQNTNVACTQPPFQLAVLDGIVEFKGPVNPAYALERMKMVSEEHKGDVVPTSQAFYPGPEQFIPPTSQEFYPAVPGYVLVKSPADIPVPARKK
jgi:hypothetical protein